MRPLWAVSISFRRARLMSMMVTSAPMPAAMTAAFSPATPPPMTTTFAGRVPGTPPMRIPDPPLGCCRCTAPICAASRPATSDIGASSGRVWPEVTVS